MKAMPYAVAAAMRGPDYDAPMLKHMFTARIRFFSMDLYLLGIDILGDIRMPSPLHEGALEIARKEALAWRRDNGKPGHFIVHAIYALRRLQEDTNACYLDEIRELIGMAIQLEDWIYGYRG